MKLSLVVMILGQLFFVSEVVLSLLRRSKTGAKSHDGGSLWAMWIILFFGAGFAGFAANAWPETRLHPFEEWQIAGCALLVLGLALRWWSIIYLGRFFTVNVAVHDQHRVVDTGPYRYVRHPSYTGALMAFLGLALGMGSWISIMSIALTSVVAYTWRIRVEEQALAGALGENYRRYMQRTKRLVPGIY